MPEEPKVGESGTHTIDRGGSDPTTRSPNDDRSIVHDPDSPAHEADRANRTKQGGK